MFFGEFLSLVLFLTMKWKFPARFETRRKRALLQGKSDNLNRFLIALPAFADCITSTLHYTALNFIPGSVYQMMRGSTVITTMMFSILFLNKKLKRHQILGCVVLLSGVLIVALSNLLFAKEVEYDINIVNIFIS